MIHTAVLVLKFLINLRFKQLGDIPNFIQSILNSNIDAICSIVSNTLHRVLTNSDNRICLLLSKHSVHIKLIE